MKFNRVSWRATLSIIALLPATAMADVEVVVGPRITVVEREGITGGGCPVVVGDRVLSFYPNHPDDGQKAWRRQFRATAA